MRAAIRGVRGREKKTRRGVLRSILSCVLCGRSGGHLREDDASRGLCTKCRNEHAPTRIAKFVELLGGVDEFLALAPVVSRASLQRAMRGNPLGEIAATKLSKATGISFELLRAGEPLQLRTREVQAPTSARKETPRVSRGRG